MYVIEVDDVAGDKHRRFCENIKRRTQHSLMGLTVEIAAGSDKPQTLTEGDAIVFEADVPHVYKNLVASEAVLYLVMTYADDAT